jgi:hypothetical protein
MLGESCHSLELDARGVKGDRIYAIRDANGKFGSGKNTRRFRKIEGLAAFTATLVEDQPSIVFPDGTTMRGDAQSIDSALSSTLGQAVTLAREASVSHLDAGPVHILTTSSLAWLKHRLPGCGIDARRFRPNIVVDAPGEELVERDWLGKTIMIGDVTLKIQDQTERCGMVAFQQTGLAFEPRILRTITQQAGLQFGVYADVVDPGRIDKSDPVLVVGGGQRYSDVL